MRYGDSGVDGSKGSGDAPERPQRGGLDCGDGCHALVPVGLFASDGLPLTAFRNRIPRPTALVCNAVGVRAAVLEPLARALASHVETITWESRAFPGATGAGDALGPVPVATHVSDAVSVLDGVDAQAAVVIGWCTGARVAIRLARAHLRRVRALVLLNGGYGLEGVARTPFEETMESVMPKLAREPRYAAAVHQAFFKQAALGQPLPPDSTVSRMLAGFGEDVAAFTRAPYETPEFLHRYARLIAGFASEPLTAVDTEIDVPALVLTGTEDTTTSQDASEAVSGMLPRGRFVKVRGADHFGLYRSEVLREVVSDFLGSLEGL